MSKKRCPAITFPEGHQCMLNKGHKGIHVASRQTSKKARRKIREAIAKLVESK